MNLQIGDTAPDVEPEATEVVLETRKHNGGAPKHLLEAIARTTACSPMVFAGLLAWASLDAPHIPSKGRSGPSRGRSPLPRGQQRVGPHIVTNRGAAHEREGSRHSH